MADHYVKHCKSFTISFKRQAIGVINELMKSGLSFHQATDHLQIHHWYYARWKKTMQTVENLIKKDEVLPFSIGEHISKLHPGRQSSLTAIKNALSHSIFELHEQGLQVNTPTVWKEASRLSSNFKNKTCKGKIRSVQNFIQSIGMSHRMSTHVAQKDHKETEEESHHFILMMRNKVAGMDPDYVVNMDQTSI
jgi:hypothetical protein